MRSRRGTWWVAICVAAAGTLVGSTAAGDEGRRVGELRSAPIGAPFDIVPGAVDGTEKRAGKVIFFSAFTMVPPAGQPLAVLAVLEPTLAPKGGQRGPLFDATGAVNTGLVAQARSAKAATFGLRVHDFTLDPRWQKAMTARAAEDDGVDPEDVRWPRWREQVWTLRIYGRPTAAGPPVLLGTTSLPRKRGDHVIEAKVALDGAALKTLSKVRTTRELLIVLTAPLRTKISAQAYGDVVSHRVSLALLSHGINQLPLGWERRASKWPEHALCAADTKEKAVQLATAWLARKSAGEFRLGPLRRLYDYSMDSVRRFVRPYADTTCVEVTHRAVGSHVRVVVDEDFVVAVDRKALPKRMHKDEAALTKVLRALIVEASALSKKTTRPEAYDSKAGLLLSPNGKSRVAGSDLDERSRALARALGPALRALATGKGALYGLDLKRLEALTQEATAGKPHGKPALEHWVEVHFAFRADGSLRRPERELDK